MKLLNVLAVFAFIAVAKGAVNITSCKFCLEENIANCTKKNEMLDCSNNTFPNIGTTHCYTAAAYYMEGGEMKSGIARGCSNSTVNAAYFKMRFDAHVSGANLTAATFNIEYCDNANNCNNQTVSSLSLPTNTAPPGATVTTTTTSHATRLFPIIGIVAFVAIILAVTL